MANLRALLCLLLLGALAGAQDKPEHIRLREAEEKVNEDLRLEIDRLTAELDRAETRREDLKARLALVRERHEALRGAYAQEGPDVPTEDEALTLMRLLEDRPEDAVPVPPLADPQAKPLPLPTLEELGREKSRYLAIREQAAGALVDLADRPLEARERARKAYEGEDWEQEEAAAWTRLEEERTRLLKLQRRTAVALVNRLSELESTRRRIDATLRSTLFLLRRENLFLRGRSHITGEALLEGAEDLGQLPSWLGAKARGLGSYLVDPQRRGGLLRLLSTLVVVLVALVLLRRWARSRAAAGGLKAAALGFVARMLGALCFAVPLFLLPLLAAEMLDGLAAGVRDWLRVLAYVLGGAWLTRIVLLEFLRAPAEEARARMDPVARRRLVLGVRLLVYLTVVFVPVLFGLEYFGYANRGVVELGWLVYETLLALIVVLVLLRRSVLAALLPAERAGAGRFAEIVVRYVRPVLVLVVPAILILDALRYDILAGLLTRVTLAAFAVLILGALAFRLARGLIDVWMRAVYAEDRASVQRKHEAARGGLLFLLRVVFFLVALSAFLSLAGSDMEELRQRMSSPLPLLGGTATAPTWWNLAVGIFLLVVFLRGTKHAKAALQELVLARTKFDKGVQYTITTLAGYLLVFTGVYLGIREVFDLSNLGYIVAALSVGIGFGLQEIISNFVSGLILLFERPLKVGDLIEVGSTEGVVKQINIRATTVLTRDNVYMLVPNREFIGQTVINFRHHDPKIRHHLGVGVSYGSDTALVKKVLLEVADAHEEVLKRPKPEVWFRNFGNSSLDFELLIWIADPPQKNRIHSELCFAIFDAFAEHGIEIPFPQRDLHLKSAEPLRIDQSTGPDSR